MRVRFSSVLVSTLVLAACQAHGTVTDTQRKEISGQVAQVVDSVFAAMNAGDADAVLSHYRNSDELMSATVVETLTGWKTFSQVTRSFYAQHPDVRFEHHILQIQVLAPDVAVATIGGSATTSEFLLWTDVFVREDGRWVITLEHESWPGAKAPSAHPDMVPQGGGVR